MNARASENYLAIARSASKSVEIFWAVLGPNLVSFNRTLVVPYEISKVNFHAENIFLSVCQKRFNKNWKYQYK